MCVSVGVCMRCLTQELNSAASFALTLSHSFSFFFLCLSFSSLLPPLSVFSLPFLLLLLLLLLRSGAGGGFRSVNTRFTISRADVSQNYTETPLVGCCQLTEPMYRALAYTAWTQLASYIFTPSSSSSSSDLYRFQSDKGVYMTFGGNWVSNHNFKRA